MLGQKWSPYFNPPTRETLATIQFILKKCWEIGGMRCIEDKRNSTSKSRMSAPNFGLRTASVAWTCSHDQSWMPCMWFYRWLNSWLVHPYLWQKDELKYASFVELGTQIKRQPWWYLGGTGCLDMKNVKVNLGIILFWRKEINKPYLKQTAKTWAIYGNILQMPIGLLANSNTHLNQ